MSVPSPDRFQLRPATSSDLPFWKRLHGLTMRAHVEAIWGWDEAVQDDLVRARFRPEITAIITVAGVDAGGLAREEVDGAILLSVIMLLPDHQRRGIGTALVRGLMAEAAGRGVAVRLSVLRPNPARHFYERLGFITTSHDAIRFEMRWSP